MLLSSSRDLLYVDEVIDLLRVSRATVYRWSASGYLTYLRLGGRRRYPRVAVEALLAAGVVCRS